ncbi:MAG: hypothetical protein HYX24_04455 [Candidatus Aenigmarchaeota archaeon]|nr:hypothetical protein [Candidatus Aenigmarchaeota archaeon]
MQDKKSGWDTLPIAIRTVIIIFVAKALLGVFAIMVLSASMPSVTLGTTSGQEMKPLSSFDYVGSAVASSVFYALIALYFIEPLLYLGAAILLQSMTRISFYLAAFLSLLSLLSIPLGTVLGLVSLYLLISSMEYFGFKQVHNKPVTEKPGKA